MSGFRTSIPSPSLRRGIATLSAFILGAALLTVPAQASAAGSPGVSGQVTAGSSGPADQVTVTLFGNNGLQYDSTVTDSAGEYSFTGIAEGMYQLHFAPAAADPYAPVWLGNVPFRTSSFYLPVTDALIDVDAILPDEGSISGTVTYDAAVPDENKTARVSAFLFDPGTGVFQAAGDPVPVAPDGSYRIGQLNAGDYAVRFDGAGFVDLNTVYWPDAEVLFDSDAVTVYVGDDTDSIGYDAMDVSDAGWQRLSGSNRFTTAVAISQATYPEPMGGIDSLWIANGYGFPDALSAGPAAALDAAPLLLVAPNSIPGVVLDEIQRLSPDHIYVAGGSGVVSNAVLAQLDALAGSGATRFGGGNRYETSRIIVQEFFGGDIAPVVTLADGRNYPDALAAGPAISPYQGPVILINGGSSTVDAATEQLLEDLETVSITLAGGTGVISSQLERSLHATPGILEVIRDHGTNRYETANALNRRAFPSADAVFLATGAGFADALAGSAVAGTVVSPLFLVQKNCVPPDVMTTIASLRPTVVFLLGGTGVLGTGIEDLAICGGGFGTDLMMRSDSGSILDRGSQGGDSAEWLPRLLSAEGW